MRSMARRVMLGVLGLVLGVGLSVEGAEPVGKPDGGVKELAVLDRMAGEWETQLDHSEDKVSGGRRWVLDGKFLQQDFAVSNGNLRGIMIRGYDQRRNCYTMTYLDTQGNTSFLTGYWNEDQKILSFDASHRESFMQKYESYFPDAETEQWTVTVLGDDSGAATVTGVARRKGAR